jgi:hypothetical protein
MRNLESMIPMFCARRSSSSAAGRPRLPPAVPAAPAPPRGTRRGFLRRKWESSAAASMPAVARARNATRLSAQKARASSRGGTFFQCSGFMLPLGAGPE